MNEMHGHRALPNGGGEPLHRAVSYMSDVVAGKTQSTNYGISGTNRSTVIAIDSNGNRSEAGTTTIVFNF